MMLHRDAASLLLCIGWLKELADGFFFFFDENSNREITALKVWGVPDGWGCNFFFTAIVGMPRG